MTEINHIYQPYLPGISIGTGLGRLSESDWTKFAEEHQILINLHPLVHRTWYGHRVGSKPGMCKKNMWRRSEPGSPWLTAIKKTLEKK